MRVVGVVSMGFVFTFMNSHARTLGYGFTAAILLIAVSVIVADAQETAWSLTRPTGGGDAPSGDCVMAAGDTCARATTAITSDAARVVPCSRAKYHAAPTGPRCKEPSQGLSLVCGQFLPFYSGTLPEFSSSLVAAGIRLQI